MSGTLYGISTGPGDPELLTLRAVRILRQCSVIAAPKKQNGESLALHIAGSAVDLSDKRILPLSFPMTRDEQQLAENDHSIATQLCDILVREDAAVLCLGDISLYATFSPIAALVRKKGFTVKLVPGVTSFCAAAARTGVPLVCGTEPLQILPYDCHDLRERLHLPGAKVVMKCGSQFPALVRLLQEENMLSHAYAVENCGLENERCLSLTTLDADVQCGYFTVVYVGG